MTRKTDPVQLTHTGVLDFGSFKMACGITSERESVIMQNDFHKVFGNDWLNYFEDKRFKPHYPEGFDKSSITRFRCRLPNGKIEYAYPSDAVNMLCMTVIFANIHGVADRPEDKKMLDNCLTIARQLLPTILAAYENWLEHIQGN